MMKEGIEYLLFQRTLNKAPDLVFLITRFYVPLSLKKGPISVFWQGFPGPDRLK
jgi:hypothetical protein